MGVTLGCARCHDHKYDPITQDDYFRIQAFFAGYRPVEVPICSPEEKAQYEAKLRQWRNKPSNCVSKSVRSSRPYSAS
jgi:hypothetical protein